MTTPAPSRSGSAGDPAADRSPERADNPAFEPADQGAATARGHRPWLVEHRPFLVALLLAALLRLTVQLAYTPGLVHSDGPTYLGFLDTFEPSQDHPAGYGLFLLYPVSLLTDRVVLAATITQHLLGLATAVLVYLLLRRWGVGRWAATLATLPVLFDGLALIMEATVLSDTLFAFLVVAAVVVLGWQRRPTAWLAFAAGALLGLSVTVRLVGEPLVLVGVAFCLLAGRGWRARVAAAAALTVGFALPLGAYATWYHHERGIYALSEFGGRSIYTRTTTFVDCPRLSVPRYERVLCPPEPLGHRFDPTYYAWLDERTLPRLRPPPGSTPDDAMREFGLEAIRVQPLDYAGIALRDFALNFDVWRGDRFEYALANKWRFGTYLHPNPTERLFTAYDTHGGEQLAVHHPAADVLAGYSWVVYLPGPALLGCLVLGLLGGLGVGRARRSGLRSICLLLTVTGAGLLAIPDLTTDFSWRYQVPALALLPAGAALGLRALRGGHADPEALGPETGPVSGPESHTVATARTD